MPHFSGQTYSPELDHARLSTALGRVYTVLADEKWHTLKEIAEKARTSEAGCSARIRNLRETQWQRIYKVAAVHSERLTASVWRYRIVLGDNQPVPAESAPDGFLFDNTPIKPERNNNAARM